MPGSRVSSCLLLLSTASTGTRRFAGNLRVCGAACAARWGKTGCSARRGAPADSHSMTLTLANSYGRTGIWLSAEPGVIIGMAVKRWLQPAGIAWRDPAQAMLPNEALIICCLCNIFGRSWLMIPQIRVGNSLEISLKSARVRAAQCDR